VSDKPLAASDLSTDRRRVEGLGSAKHGADVWIKERVSSLVLAPLTVWGLWAGARLAGGGYDAAIAWLQSPLNAVLLALLVGTSLYHMHLGMRVIVEDYIHGTASKGALLFINFIVCLALGAAALFSILKVALPGVLGAV
jgi:succinate dehydrogenase / fumarate reductase membrane anchor subunit